MTQVRKAMTPKDERGRQQQVYYEITPKAITGFEKEVRKIVNKMKKEGTI